MARVAKAAKAEKATKAEREVSVRKEKVPVSRKAEERAGKGRAPREECFLRKDGAVTSPAAKDTTATYSRVPRG